MEYFEQIVKNRHSCRGFADKKVSDKVLNELILYYEDEESDLVDEISTELKFYVGTVWNELRKSVGYNGFCIKAPAYMVIFSEVADHYIENAGYIAQGLTLKMTELGLAACWLTINDAEAAKAALGADTDKEVACVVAFGYRDPANKEKAVDKKNVDEMTDGFRYGQDIPVDLFYRELEDALRAVARAQSFQNKQPYKIIVDYDQISLIGLPDDETSDRDRLLNYGIVMFNFYSVMWSVRPTTPRWSFDPVTDRDLKLPASVTYVAKCGL
ncbi:MAG: nitroreductase family protein [Mogibacterium sp.]|nr:nitroreductase family protein [Mogibacterium sp.]